MCGIVAAVSHCEVTPFLIKGLKTLEYRGYDSAGVALLNGSLHRARSMGRVAELELRVLDGGLSGQVGIAHTRWATHGVPAERNAHPHVSGGRAVVNNGIIENHQALREQLEGLGYRFTDQVNIITFGSL